jgi:hypothetical protein
MNEHIPHLNIESLDDGNLRLENESMGDSYVVDIHPLHLRYMAEKLGLVREVSASEADALRTVTTLKRRLRVLLDRINHLDDWLHQHSDTAHADLSYEQTYSMATWELASEFCADLDQPAEETQTKPAGNPN